MLDPISWLPTVGASFTASLVECVEALTVVLAVGTVRGWRWTLTGAGAAVLALAVVVAALGPSVARIPITLAQLVVGTLLLLFGVRWLRKAILRYARVIALHDEEEIYAKQTRSLNALAHASSQAWDGVAFAGAFKIVMLEGMEVVFIVIAMGAGGALMAPAAVGAVAALAVVAAFGAWLHRPLARVPENSLKFIVGVMLTAFGTFWAGEGMHVLWPGADWSLPALIAIYGSVSVFLATLCRTRRPAHERYAKPAPAQPARTPAAQPTRTRAALTTRALAALATALASLFIDDGSLAAGTLAWLVLTWTVREYTPLPAMGAAIFLLAGVGGLLGRSVHRAARR